MTREAVSSRMRGPSSARAVQPGDRGRRLCLLLRHGRDRSRDGNDPRGHRGPDRPGAGQPRCRARRCRRVHGRRGQDNDLLRRCRGLRPAQRGLRPPHAQSRTGPSPQPTSGCPTACSSRSRRSPNCRASRTTSRTSPHRGLVGNATSHHRQVPRVARSETRRDRSRRGAGSSNCGRSALLGHRRTGANAVELSRTRRSLARMRGVQPTTFRLRIRNSRGTLKNSPSWVCMTWCLPRSAGAH